MILAESWDRLKDDPAATKQRWYCSCGARYKTKYGVLLEVGIQKGIDEEGEPIWMANYCRAELPTQDIMDAKLCKIEEDLKERHGEAKVSQMSPEDVLRSLPNIKPLDEGAFLRPQPQEGHYKIMGQSISSLPEFTWAQLYNIASVKAVPIEGALQPGHTPLDNIYESEVPGPPDAGSR